MKQYEAKRIIQDVFESGFDKEKFAYFIKNLLKNLEEKPFGNGGAYTGNIIPRAFQSVIRKMERIGKFEDEEGNMFDVLVVELNRDHSIEYARTSQRNFIRWYLNGSRGNEFKDAALVAFHTQKSPDWRFSLIKMQYSLEKGKDILTPAKRSSFLVGEKGKSHTAQQQLVGLLKNDYPPYLSNLEDAFNIEAVSDEFYEKYKAQLFNLKEELDKIIETDNIIQTEFKLKKIDTLNFAKKLLGQIVFLYFLQKKGWLGLKEGQSYGEGNRNFMRDLFEQAKTKGKNFFNDYLEFLFYDALSQKRTTDFYEKFNCRIPFLNGGLFDPIKFYDWENKDIPIPNKLFSNKTDDDEEGTGILDIFDLYNFTVKEDEPLEKEVAIDPEMLGKVFERMLEVKERKSKGAFYTPREIVHYMAQQSLIYFLETELNKTFSYTKLGSNQPDLFGNETKKGQLDLTIENKYLIVPKEDLETFIHFGEQIIDKDIAIETGKLKESNNKYKIPKSIRNNADAIDKALENIKICDPAVGSGAFPVGVMNEIVKLRNLLTPFVIASGAKQSDNNRTSYFFKSNAIQNSIYGVDIDAGAVEIAKLRLWLSMVVDESNINRIDPLPNLEYKIVRGNSLLGFPKNYESQASKEISDLINQYYSITDKKEKQKQKKIIDNKIGERMAKSEANFGYKIDFDFKLYFHEVFNEKGGFDVVIGNPPYIQLQKAFDEKRKYADLYKNMGFQTFERTGDIYALFYEKGIEILHTNGFSSYITSNKWMRANYGKSLRRFFSQKNPLLLLDLGPGIFSSATVDTNILLIAKTQNVASLKAITLNEAIEELKNDDFITLTKLSEDSWIILSPKEQKIKERIEQIGTPLKDWDISIKYGIRTGFNKAFIIDGKTKDALIAKDPKSAEIIKPILRGRDIKRYKAQFADLWIILVKKYFHGVFKTQYPILYKYVAKYEEELKNRGQVRSGSHHWIELDNSPTDKYLQEFEKEKIVFQEMVQESSFLYDAKKNYFCNDTGRIITGQNIKFLVSILNSNLFFYAIKYFYGGGGLGSKGVRMKHTFFENFSTPRIPKSRQKPFETLVNYIIFLKSQPNDTQSFYFEQIIDGMVYELYFEEEVKKAGCEIIKHLQNLPEFTKSMSDSEKQEIIDKVFAELYDKNHPVRKNLYFIDSVEAVKTIKERLEK